MNFRGLKRYQDVLALSCSFLVLALIFWIVMAAYGRYFIPLQYAGWWVSGVIFIVLFQVIGFVSVGVSNRMVSLYLEKPFSKLWFVAAYLSLLVFFALFNYGALVVGRYFYGDIDLFALPHRGFYTLFPMWLTEISAMSMILLVRANKMILRYKRKLDIVQMENTKARYTALQSQLNPHFLFNSFNALVSEIETNPGRASVFARSIAQIYRYVLDKQSEIQVILGEELDFAEQYVYLYRVRFENAVEYTSNVPEKDKSAYSLPPLSMQLLLENVFKHNFMSEEHCIEIRVYIEDRSLVVSNVKNLRFDVDSTGKGLMNLDFRVRQLTGAGVEVVESEDLFTVKVPLLS